MFKSIKNNLPLVPFIIVAGLLLFPIWSHIDQEAEIDILAQENQNLGKTIEGIRFNGGDDLLVGASTLFAQNASVQLNLEVMGTYASVSGNLSFYGELMPDGATCANDQILKKTGANDWDCAADDTGAAGAKAFGWIDANNTGGTFVSIGSISFDPGHFNFTNTASQGFLRIDWDSVASLSTAETIAGNWVNTANPWAVNEGGTGAATLTGLLQGNGTSAFSAISDSSTVGQVLRVTGASTYAWGALDLDDGDAITGTLGSTNIEDIYLFNSGDTATGKMFFSAGASVSANNFEVIGISSASFFDGSAFGGIDCNDNAEGLQWSGGLFTCRAWADADIPDAITVSGGTIGSNNISSGVTWTTLGTLTIGDNGDAVNFDTSTWDVSAGIFSGVLGMTGTGVYDFGGATSFEIPNGTLTIDAAGEIGVKTASASSGHAFRNHDGTAERVLSAQTCFGLNYPLPTAKDHLTIWNAYDPFTIGSVYMVASGSNAVGWNIKHGKTVGTLTNLFGINKSGSTTFDHTSTPYTTFADATIADGERLDFVVTSASATIDSIMVRVCGFYDP